MSINLFDYQIKCVNFMKNNDGLILYHSMGSGKTITSLVCAAQFEYPIIIICTKSSKKNFMDDIKKIIEKDINNFPIKLSNLSSSNIKILTYQKAINLIIEQNISFKDFTLIVDEAHHLRTQSKLMNILINELLNSKKILLLTGTVFYNSLTDISPIVNLIKKREILPLTMKEFKYYYYDDTYEIPTNTDFFTDQLKGTISRHIIDSENDPNYPSSKIEYYGVDMSNAQISQYRHYMKKILSLQGLQNIDFSMIDKRKANNFLTVTRQLSNTVDKNPNSPKIIAVADYIKKVVARKGGQIIVYSNFIDYGVLPLSVHLQKENITFQIFHGQQSESKRDDIIDNYNKGNFNVLLITSVGSESLDLKNTRFIHLLEPHWNDSKEHQIIGRSIRFNSHSDLPFEDRNVTIIHWYSVFGYKIPYETADEYLIKLAKQKTIMFNQFDKLIEKASI